VLHGLWPQYENNGYPASCGTDVVPQSVIDSMLDIMPSEDLVRHEWAKHGTCSGKTPEDYFKAACDAFGAITMPEALRWHELVFYHVEMAEAYRQVVARTAPPARPLVEVTGGDCLGDDVNLLEVRDEIGRLSPGEVPLDARHPRLHEDAERHLFDIRPRNSMFSVRGLWTT